MGILYHFTYEGMSHDCPLFYYSLFFNGRNRDFLVLFHLIYQGTVGQTIVEVGDKFLTHKFMATIHDSTECLFSSVALHLLNLTHSITVAVIPILEASDLTTRVHTLLLYLSCYQNSGVV